MDIASPSISPPSSFSVSTVKFLDGRLCLKPYLNPSSAPGSVDLGWFSPEMTPSLISHMCKHSPAEFPGQVKLISWPGRLPTPQLHFPKSGSIPVSEGWLAGHLPQQPGATHGRYSSTRSSVTSTGEAGLRLLRQQHQEE